MGFGEAIAGKGSHILPHLLGDGLRYLVALGSTLDEFLLQGLHLLAGSKCDMARRSRSASDRDSPARPWAMRSTCSW